MKKRIKSLIADFSYYVIIMFSKIVASIPKKKNLWVFGAWGGQLYADNSKYEFEYICKEHQEIEAVWISRNKEVVEKVRKKGYTSYTRHSLKGIWTCIRAQVVFMTEDRHDVSRTLTNGATLIQLWHGMGIKDITTFFLKDVSKAREKYENYVHSHKREYWMTACQDANLKYSKAFDLPSERIFITGQPKDDMFAICNSNKFIDNIRSSHPNHKIWAYLPTHRNFGKGKNNRDVLAYDTLLEVNEMLKVKNIVMIFKPHAHEFKNYENLNTNLSNIIFATDAAIYEDIYEFLPSCDGMITDYSGIMLGYLTGLKPIVYFVYDYEDYINGDAGFCFQYNDVVAGPICKSWDETIEAVTEAYEQDKYLERRKKMQMRFSPYTDGNNRKRVFEKVQSILISSTDVS